MTRASSNMTINSTASQSQVFTDGDMSNVSNDSGKGKATKRPKLFGGSSRSNTLTKNSPVTTKPVATPSTPSTPTPVVQNSTKTSPVVANSNQNDSNNLTNTHESPSSSNSMPPNGRKNTRFSPDQSFSFNTRTPPIHIKPDRRKDIKITNCQEKDGIWTATGQFGRESRHSKRADITYDKKKFRFIQKDDQGNKHVFEIQAQEIEGKHFRYT